MGDGRAGLLDGGQCGVATGLGPRPELPPGGAVGPAGVSGLGVPESCGDGLGRLAVALGQIQGVAELLDDGEIGGHGRPVKFVIIPYYHEFRGCPHDPRSGRRTPGHSRQQAHLQEDLELSASDREAAQAVAEGLRDAKAANTGRVYGSAWHEFCVWALESGRQSLPADPRTVALYLGHLAADGKAMAAMATIALARAAISHAHAAAWIAKGDNPARNPVVGEMVKGWRNQTPAPRQAGARADSRGHHTYPRDCLSSAARPRWTRGDTGCQCTGTRPDSCFSGALSSTVPPPLCQRPGPRCSEPIH